MIKPGIGPKAFMLSDFKHTMQTMEVIIERYRAHYSCLSFTHLNVHMDFHKHVNVGRKHFLFLSSFMTYHRVCN